MFFSTDDCVAVMALTEKENYRKVEGWGGCMNGKDNEFSLWKCHVFMCLYIFL